MKEERFPNTRSPFTGRDRGWRLRMVEGKLQSHSNRVQSATRRGSRTEDQCPPALNRPRGLSAHPPGRAGLGAEALASVGSQGEDWGWRREHSLKGLAHHS